MGCQGSKSSKAVDAVKGDTTTSDAATEQAEYNTIIGGHKDAIAALFKRLDKNADATLNKAELKKLVSRYNGEAFDEAKFFGWFDVHGSCGTGPDGALDLKEFGWYVADVCKSFPGDPQEACGAVLEKFEQIVDAYTEQAEYSTIIASHKDAIAALFNKLDKNADATLNKAELKKLISRYNGEAFDEAKFFGWFDVHGSCGTGPDGALDLKEFGWYVADVCKSFPGDPQEACRAVLEKFEQIVAEP